MDSTQRFSSRVETYLKYRPHYPKAVIDTLQRDCRLTSEDAIADIGSGTGFLSELFLQNNNKVFAVEPNLEMRTAGETYCHQYNRFESIDATAEATTLAPNSIDFVVAGQAFHWFDYDLARLEFSRILKPNGHAVLIWNDRENQSTPFLRDYEKLLQDYGVDYREVNHKGTHKRALTTLFGEGAWTQKDTDYHQLFDHEGLEGRLMSCSYAPESGHVNHKPMLAHLSKIFHDYCIDGRVKVEYKTRMFYGPLRS